MSGTSAFDPTEQVEGLDDAVGEDVDEEDAEEEDAEEGGEATVAPEVLADWCGLCAGRCCRYYTVIIDEPEDADNFDELRWFLAHEGNYVYVDEGEWHVNVESRCRFLGPEGRCAIYEHRPDVCRDHGHAEECEWTGEFDFEHTFRNLRELEAYAKEVLAPEEFAKLPAFPDDWAGPV